MHLAAEPPDHYADRAEEMDTEYLDAWRKLTPAMREKLRKRGINGPELNSYESKQGSRDVSDFVELKAPLPPITERERLSDEIAERFGLEPEAIHGLIEFFLAEIEREAERRKTDYLARVVGPLLYEDNVKVSVYGLAFALNFKELARNGITSMHAAAKIISSSPAYISASANNWCDVLELPRSPLLKSGEARKTYRTERRKNHWRTQVCQMPPKPQ